MDEMCAGAACQSTRDPLWSIRFVFHWIQCIMGSQREGFPVFDIRRHSSKHIEVKITYPFFSTHGYTKVIDHYIFSPPQLNVSPKTISRESLIRKFQSHGRYSTPRVSFDEILDEHNGTSPLIFLDHSVRLLSENRRVQSDTLIIHTIQLLANTFRGHESSFDTQVRERSINASQVDKWLASAREILKRYRVISKNLKLVYPMGNKLTAAFEWGDEEMSLQIESAAVNAYQAGIELKCLLDIVREEHEYRRRKSYASVTEEGRRKDEKYQYRCAELKKWTQSLLYLHPVISKAPQRMSSILAGAAAAIAMTFATLAAIFAEAIFIENSLPWAMMIILAYVFKDRIKEGLRALFSATIPNILADKIIHFRSPWSGRKLMKAKMLIQMSPSSFQPQNVQLARESVASPFFDILPEEDVVHYRRITKVFRSREDHRVSDRLSALTVVLRIRLDDWMKEMDDSEDDIFIPTEDIGLARTKSMKVYHLYLLSTIQDGSGHTEELQLNRIVMNTEGIVRIEPIPMNS